MCKVTPNSDSISRASSRDEKKKARSMRAERPSNYLSIKQVMELTNVTRATVHHYLEFGIIPKPIKTSHNMAYYSPKTAEIIAITKELRKRFIPLSKVKEVLDLSGILGIKDLLRKTSELGEVMDEVVRPDGPGMSKDDILNNFSITSEDIEVLENLELCIEGEDGVYDQLSVEIISVLSRLIEAGVSEGAGFKLADLHFYKDAISELISKEASYLSEKLISMEPKDDVFSLLKTVLRSSEDVLILLRRRMILKGYSSIELLAKQS